MVGGCDGAELNGIVGSVGGGVGWTRVGGGEEDGLKEGGGVH